MSANSPNDLPAIVSGSIAAGDRVIRSFELEFATLHGGGQAYSFSGGRVSHAAKLDGLDVRPGDEIIVPAYTCVAVPNPILFRGAVPVYADISPVTLNLDPQDAQRKVSPRTKAIVIQHTFGLPVEMEPFWALARSHGLKLIEDCTHALGARYRGQSVGTLSNAAFFSSEQTKVISTGAGGVAFTKDPRLAMRLADFQAECSWPARADVRRSLAYLAFLITLGSPATAVIGDIVGYYLHRLRLIREPQTTEDELRGMEPLQFRSRMPSEIAMVAKSQLAALNGNLRRRAMVANLYFQILTQSGFGLYRGPTGAEAVFVRFPIWVPDKSSFVSYMKRFRIEIGTWFTAPIHPKEVKPTDVLYVPGSCPNAEAAVAHVANLPCHPRMSLGDARRVAERIVEFFNESQRRLEAAPEATATRLT